MSQVICKFASDVVRSLSWVRTFSLVIVWTVFTSVALAQASPRPNIVLIFTDDAGYNELGFNSQMMGQTTYVKTPNLDALAQRSVIARNGYVASSLCGPSRAGLLTGQYAQRFGFEYNGDSFGTDEVTMPQHLKGLGYTTGMIGKWHLGSVDNVNRPLDKGFDEFYGLFGGDRNYFHDTRFDKAIHRGDTFYEAQYRAEGNPAEYDPLQGRYVTDAFGDEAADFVNRRAAEENPYFLYLSFTSPHQPIMAKQSDLNHFSHLPEPKRTIAAMQYAMDRSVGKLLNAIQASGEDTIIVYTNDNGGPGGYDNTPLTGDKGLTWEGGIRVPFLISAPGLQPGVYDAPIRALDLLPTFYAAAGGNVSQIDTDGVDLMPHLTGSNPNAPHEVLVWRINSLWAVRKGDWKLEQPNGSGVRLINLATDLTESTNVAAQNPAVVEDLLRELTLWETRVRKPKVNEPGYPVNAFNRFVFRGNSASFNTFGAWMHPVTGNPVTLGRIDSDPNLILEFRTKDEGGYGATNSHTRLSGQTYMLNEVRLTGNYTAPANNLGGFTGNPLLFVKNLEGAGPKFRLDATSTGTNGKFRFDIGSELQLFDDLEITGDGTQNFFINGGIRDYYQPRSVTKSGTSVANLTGISTFHGDLRVLGGQIKLTGSNPGIDGANSIVIGGGGSLAMGSGRIITPLLDNSAGGSFQFTGGELRTSEVLGNLRNQGGNFSPGLPIDLSSITGDYTQTSGKLTIELGGTVPGSEFDRLTVGGTAALAGGLQVNLINGYVPNDGDSFNFLTAAGGLTGSFSTTTFPNLGGGWSWQLIYGPTAALLVVDVAPSTLRGDYNYNGVVDAADYVVWRNALGSTNLAADGDQDGTVDQDDYLVWRGNFGNTAPPQGSGARAGVPEPGTIVLGALAVGALIVLARRRAV